MLHSLLTNTLSEHLAPSLMRHKDNIVTYPSMARRTRKRREKGDRQRAEETSAEKREEAEGRRKGDD